MTRESSKKFQDLEVWKKAHQWVLKVYPLTKTFPKDEMFGLTSQLRRAAISVPANIAEGFKRRNLQDKAKFYNIAQSSLEECRYYLILANDLNFAKCDNLLNELEIVSRLLEKYYACVTESAKTKIKN